MGKELVAALAQKSKVSPEEVHKVLVALGLDAALKEVESAAGADRVQKLTVGDMKLGFRLGKSSVAV